MAAGELPDFSARRPPASVRITGFTSALLWVIFVQLAFVWAIVIDVVLALVVSRPIRAEHGFWSQLAAFGAVFVLMEALGFGYNKLVTTKGWFSWLMVGRPSFRPLGGPGRANFRFVIGCARYLKLRFTDEGENLQRMIGQKDALALEAVFYSAYLMRGYDPDNWQRTWDQMRRASHLDTTFGGIVESGRWNLFNGRLAVVERMVLPLTTLYMVGTTWLLANFASGSDLLPLLQFTLVTGFIVALVIFVNFTVSFRSVYIAEENPAMSRSDIDKALSRQGLSQLDVDQSVEERAPGLLAEVASYEGRQFFPEITIQPGYVELVRNRFSRGFFVIGLLNVVTATIFLLLQWPVARSWSEWTTEQVDSWTKTMLLFVPLIPVALIAAMALGFMMLSRFRKFLGLLTTAVLLAAIPPILTYALGLDSVSSEAVLISSVITAVVGVVPATIAELVKEKPSSTTTA